MSENAVMVRVNGQGSKKSLLNRCDTRQFLAFDGFKQGAAAGADVAHTVGQAELVDASHAVATADKAKGTVLFRGFHDGFGQGL